MSDFENDFYGASLEVKIIGFIRNEADFLTFGKIKNNINFNM